MLNYKNGLRLQLSSEPGRSTSSNHGDDTFPLATSYTVELNIDNLDVRKCRYAGEKYLDDGRYGVRHEMVVN